MVSCEFVITTSCKMFNKLVYNLLDQAKPKKKACSCQIHNLTKNNHNFISIELCLNFAI